MRPRGTFPDAQGRGRRRYAHPDEIKFCDRKPADGQLIAYRRHGCKGYYCGKYNAATDSITAKSVGAPLGEESIRYLMGWLPLPTLPSRSET